MPRNNAVPVQNRRIVVVVVVVITAGSTARGMLLDLADLLDDLRTLGMDRMVLHWRCSLKVVRGWGRIQVATATTWMPQLRGAQLGRMLGRCRGCLLMVLRVLVLVVV